MTKNSINILSTANGDTLSGCTAIKAEILRYYECPLGSSAAPNPNTLQILRLLTTRLQDAYHSRLIANVTLEEIVFVVKVLPNNKSPGLDGFTTEFFKATWEITGVLVTSAVHEFFPTGQLLKEFNATLISLVPKCPNPTNVNDYRPIL